MIASAWKNLASCHALLRICLHVGVCICVCLFFHLLFTHSKSFQRFLAYLPFLPFLRSPYRSMCVCVSICEFKLYERIFSMFCVNKKPQVFLCWEASHSYKISIRYSCCCCGFQLICRTLNRCQFKMLLIRIFPLNTQNIRCISLFLCLINHLNSVNTEYMTKWWMIFQKTLVFIQFYTRQANTTEPCKSRGFLKHVYNQY